MTTGGLQSLRSLTLGTKRPLRVAAYCRVSTDDNQDGSYDNQLNFFKTAIGDHPDWTFAGIYADHARTGSQVKGRTDFLRMIRHASFGRFDYILTKSISRFSRNVADTLKYIQMLSDLDVGVYFIEQGFDTMQPNGKLILSALAAVADIESASISQNLKITLDAKNELGQPTRKCSYGYVKKDEEWVIVPKESVRVKLGFLMAANGFSFSEIANRLNMYEKVDFTGRKWCSAMVKWMLQNETYVGDIMTNKTVIIRDQYGKKQVKNNGEFDKYYIDLHHEPMVGKQLFNKINEMINDKELAGQKNFKCVDEVKRIASKDPLLRDVKKLLPTEEGRCIQKLRESYVKDKGGEKT